MPRLFCISIALESAYVILIDQFAISRGIWTIYHGTGIVIPVDLFGNGGIQIEQILIYSLTTVLVIATLLPMLVITEVYTACGVTTSWFKFVQQMIRDDGKYPPMSSVSIDKLLSPA